MSGATLVGEASVAVSAEYVPAPQPQLADPTTPSLSDYTIFLRTYCGISETNLPDSSPWIQLSYDLAIAKVNPTFQCASPLIYTMMVYNYAADRLINYAPDQPGQCFFQDTRASWGLNSFTPGIIQSSSDNGTSQSWALPDWVKNMTLSMAQMARTPYGRAYLMYAQEYGTTLWGLTI